MAKSPDALKGSLSRSAVSGASPKGNPVGPSQNVVIKSEMLTFADAAEFRAHPLLADGTVFAIKGLGTWMYRGDTGTGVEDDGVTVLRPRAVATNADGRAYPTTPPVGTTAGTVAAGNDARLGSLTAHLPNGTTTTVTELLTGLQLFRRNLRIVCLGDSHTEGFLTGATVSTATGVSGPVALTSPLDSIWTGTTDSVCTGRSGINSFGTTQPHPNTDSQLGSTTPAASFVTWIPQLLRSAFPERLGTIRLANMGMGGAAAHSWSGNCAAGMINATANANDGDTFTIGGTVYTFRASVSAAYDVLIGASATATSQNFARAINADGTAGAYGAGTLIHPSVFVPVAPTNAVIGIRAIAVGAAGNGIAMSSSVAGTTRYHVLYPIGDPGQPTLIGSDTSKLWYNTIVALGGSFGTPDVFTITLGTNDSNLGGNARLFAPHLTSLVAKIHAAYPLAKIILSKPPITSVTARNTIITTILEPAVDALVAANSDFVSSIEMYSAGAGAGTTAILDSGGVHLTNMGYQVWASKFARGIAQALGLIA